MTTATVTAAGDTTMVLRRLYFARSGFALVWAVLVFATASSIGALTATLLVLYPLFDVAAAVVDARSSRTGGAAAKGLHVNIALSTLAAVGLVIALGSGVAGVLRVWGVWAVVAGLVQLVVALRRRALGGQWAMITSGSISVLAGVMFVLMAASAGASVANVAGYALLGGVFFLVSALRLGHGAGSDRAGGRK